MIRVIRSRDDYEEALAAIEQILDNEPLVGTPEAERLELLTLLVEDYEKKTNPGMLPTPVDAIRFRMEQEGLTQKDLVPFIGSKSKVSEILSGKRQLTLPMIRALHSGLGIPAKVLLQEQEGNDLEANEIEWEHYPLAEMVKRGWIPKVTNVASALANREQHLRQFFRPIGSPTTVAVLLKRTRHVRASRSMDKHALEAWIARVLIRAKTLVPQSTYTPETVNDRFLAELVRLSWFESGPQLAQEFLFRHGIPLIIEPHLPSTYLDGAALLNEAGRPIIGMTIRHDRLDNFWFCLFHELAHIRLHFLAGGPKQFVDDVEVHSSGDKLEDEADQAANEALIAQDVWEASAASQGRAPVAIRALAEELRISPAIIAGRIRRKYNDYRVLNELVGRGQVRSLFPDAIWK